MSFRALSILNFFKIRFSNPSSAYKFQFWGPIWWFLMLVGTQPQINDALKKFKSFRFKVFIASFICSLNAQTPSKHLADFLKKIINWSFLLGLFILLSCLERGVVFSSRPPGYYMYQEQLSPESKDWPELSHRACKIFSPTFLLQK